MTLQIKPIALKTTPVFQWNYEARARVVVNQGGSSSGKTYSILQVLLLRLMEKPNQVGTVVGQDIPNLKKGALRDIERIFADCPDLARFVVAHNKTDRVFSFANGSTMEFTSYQDEQDAKSGKRDYLFVNEANGVQWGIYNQLAMRTATQIFIDYNPTAAFWAHTRLMGQPDTVFFYSRYTHNPFVHPAIVAHIEAYRQSDPESWQVYGLGKTGAIQGLVFPSVNIVPELPAHYRKRAYGLDFGFNHPTACALVQETEGELYLHEILYAYEQSNKQIADALKAAGVRDAIVWCDSAEPRTIAELKVLGINAQPARKGPDSITAGIKLMKGFKRINMTADSTNARKEQQNYKYKVDRSGAYLDEPMDAWNHCFKGDTLVTTKAGLRQIKDIAPGDVILNSFGENVVLDSFLSIKSAETFLYKISCSIHNYLLNCTSNHLVKTKDGWKEISKISKGDLIWTAKSSTAGFSTFTVEKDIFQKAGTDFTGLYGNITTGKSQRGIMSTIKTIIPIITIFPILICFMVASILASTLKRCTEKALNAFASILKKSIPSLRYGTHPKPGEHGTGNTLRNLISGLLISVRETVTYVVQSLQQRQASKDSVLIIASHNIAGTWDLITRFDSALFAGVSFRLINTPKQRPVLKNVLSVQQTSKEVNDVYDLTVDTNHEFIAGGIVVHNCWDAARYASTMTWGKLGVLPGML